MKKSLVIILVVAIIGGLGVYTKTHNSSANAKTQATTSITPSVVDATKTSASTDNTATQTTGTYKDGSYDGNTARTVYGDVRVRAIISGGRLVDVKFLAMPDDQGHSQEVTNESEGPLKHSAIAKQSAHIDFVSGATQTSEGYEKSLQSALDQAM